VDVEMREVVRGDGHGRPMIVGRAGRPVPRMSRSAAASGANAGLRCPGDRHLRRPDQGSDA
jgi:hypothetical protein